jgi:hypothetical protein
VRLPLRLCTVAGFYRYALEEELPGHLLALIGLRISEAAGAGSWTATGLLA